MPIQREHVQVNCEIQKKFKHLCEMSQLLFSVGSTFSLCASPAAYQPGWSMLKTPATPLSVILHSLLFGSIWAAQRLTEPMQSAS